MHATSIRETPIREFQDLPPPAAVETVWSFPPLSTPPRSAQQLVLSHGKLSTAGWQVGWAQIIGSRHRISEDSMAVHFTKSSGTASSPTGVYAAMADGVGGGARGEVASNALALHCVHYVSESDSFNGTQDDSLRAWMLQADLIVTRAVRAVASQPGAATLAAAWLGQNGHGWLSRVGDARAYLVSRVDNMLAAEPTHHAGCSKWQANLILPDQTYAFLGEVPPEPDLAGEPARMVGAGLIGNPELAPITVGDDEMLVLCSDGLHRFLDAESLAALSAEEGEVEAVACAMVSLARARGSDDDISVLILRRDKDECFASLVQQTDD